MQRIIAFWNRGLIGKLTISLLGLVVVCCILGVIFRPSGQQRQAGQPTAVAGGATAQPVAAAQPATDQPTAAPAVTEGPTNTPAPTNTPEPTATPEPTEAPTATPEPTPAPEPAVFEGNGQAVTDPFTPPGRLTRIVATHAGERNFIIQALAEDGDETLVANGIGNYSGSRLLLSDGPVFLEIKADGAWTIRVEPIPDEPAAATDLRGTDDYVSGFFTPPSEGAVPYLFSHTGERNFIVQVHCAGGSDLAENQIGTVTDSASVVRFEEGPCLWEVQADGDWSIRPK